MHRTMAMHALKKWQGMCTLSDSVHGIRKMLDRRGKGLHREVRENAASVGRTGRRAGQAGAGDACA
jgi:hypothetical protein